MAFISKLAMTWSIVYQTMWCGNLWDNGWEPDIFSHASQLLQYLHFKSPGRNKTHIPQMDDLPWKAKVTSNKTSTSRDFKQINAGHTSSNHQLNSQQNSKIHPMSAYENWCFFLFKTALAPPTSTVDHPNLPPRTNHEVHIMKGVVT